MLTIQNLTFSFGARTVLKDLSFTLEKGKIGMLIGPSGSGKTTLFRLLTGMLALQKGAVSISGHSPPKAKHHCAYMMQEDLLLPWRNALDNMTLPGEIGPFPLPIGVLRTQARKHLRQVGLGDWEKAYPSQLSGGMRQRVSLARALMQQRPLLLLDEPFSSLDICLRDQMHSLLRDACVQYGTTILMITHDFRDALELSDRVFLLGQGKIVQEWTLGSSDKKSAAAIQVFSDEIKAAFNA